MMGGRLLTALLLLLSWSPTVWAAGQPLNAAPELGTGAVVRLLLGLLAVVGVIVALAWMLKRLGRFQGGSRANMCVLGAMAVGTRERAVLVQVGDEQLLLGVASGQVRLLHVLKEPLDLSQSSAVSTPGGAFSARLAAALKQGMRR